MSLIWSPQYYLAKSTNHHVILSILLSLALSSVQIFPPALCSQKSSIYVICSRKTYLSLSAYCKNIIRWRVKHVILCEYCALSELFS
jgi:hypothetical protein